MVAVGDDPSDLIQETGRALLSTSTANLELSSLALHWTGSNLHSADLSYILRVLGIGQDPWGQVTQLDDRAGFNVTNLESVCSELLRNRNSAAHDAQFEATIISVRSLPNSLLAIALAFDALASRAARLGREAEQDFLRGVTFNSQSIALRFVVPVGAKWKEYAETDRNRAKKVYDDRESAVLGATVDAQADRHGVVVVTDPTHGPIEWVCADVP